VPGRQSHEKAVRRNARTAFFLVPDRHSRFQRRPPNIRRNVQERLTLIDSAGPPPAWVSGTKAASAPPAGAVSFGPTREVNSGTNCSSVLPRNFGTSFSSDSRTASGTWCRRGNYEAKRRLGELSKKLGSLISPAR